MNSKLLRAVLAHSGLGHATLLFIITFAVCAALLAVGDPGVGGVGNALWCCFEAVTTIGFGDVPVTTSVGRIIVAVLSVVSIFFLAIVTAAVVNYTSELMRARRDESVALFLDKLEHLPELDRDELAALSDQVKRLRKRQS